jgi:hypothetical protein
MGQPTYDRNTKKGKAQTARKDVTVFRNKSIASPAKIRPRQCGLKNGNHISRWNFDLDQ